MTDASYLNASRSFSAVVPFKSRDLIVPKGIDGGEMLAWASSDEFLSRHLELGCDAKAFWKDGFLLYTLWAMGDFCGMVPPAGCSPIYPYTRAGFCQFLCDHGSQISAEEATRRIKVFRAYNRFGVTIVRMVEKAGLKKSFVAIPYIRDETVIDLMRLCIKTPYHRLRPALQEAYPRTDRPREHDSMPKEELRRAAERRALRVIAENEYGMIGDPGIFIPRQYRQHAEDELRAHEVFEIAMSRLGTDDRDTFFMRVVQLVANTWLTKDDRQAVEQLLSEQRYFGRAQP